MSGVFVSSVFIRDRLAATSYYIKKTLSSVTLSLILKILVKLPHHLCLKHYFDKISRFNSVINHVSLTVHYVMILLHLHKIHQYLQRSSINKLLCFI